MGLETKLNELITHQYFNIIINIIIIINNNIMIKKFKLS